MTPRTAPASIADHWPAVRRMVPRSRLTTLAVSVATVDSDGAPRVAPIGSLMLDRSEPAGWYFELFTAGTRANLEAGSRVSVLAVDAGKMLWLRALLSGRFPRPPAVRLLGVAGERRRATPAEVQRWQRRLGPLRRTRGGRALWSTLEWVRDLRFDAFEPVDLGSTTHGLWVV